MTVPRTTVPAVVGEVPHMADVRYFLRLGDIAGGSTSEGHPHEIELLSFSWGVHSTATPAAGGGGGAGKVVVDALTVMAASSLASPRLFQACATGRHLRDAVLTGWRDDEAGRRRLDFLVIRLADVLVASYAVSGGADEAPEDEVTLTFSRVEVEQTDGSTMVKVGWDVAQNRAF